MSPRGGASNHTAPHCSCFAQGRSGRPSVEESQAERWYFGGASTKKEAERGQVDCGMSSRTWILCCGGHVKKGRWEGGRDGLWGRICIQTPAPWLVQQMIRDPQSPPSGRSGAGSPCVDFPWLRGEETGWSVRLGAPREGRGCLEGPLRTRVDGWVVFPCILIRGCRWASKDGVGSCDLSTVCLSV